MMKEKSLATIVVILCPFACLKEIVYIHSLTNAEAILRDIAMFILS